ncbi:MAG: hypothetical protein JNL70_26310 [Saprospiraceae bacterium]|nr:hypothetical protein [Saprospiraceae bacterium]
MKYIIPLLLFVFALPIIGKAQEDTVKKIERPCPLTFDIKKGEKTYSLPYASNHPMAEHNKKIKQLIIYIHGARRNGLDYYEWGEAAVKSANKDDETLFIAPQFTSEKDLEDHKHNENHLFWANNNWRIGDESVSSKKRKMTDAFSSFSLVDSMITCICNPQLFPKLKKVIVIGHSAGGQFVSRYAGMTPMPNILRGYKFRFIIMNPSTYMYLDDRRPTKTADKLTFARPDTTGCSNFNEYPRGFEKLNPYASKIGEATIKQQFLTRDIAFILGGSDTDMTDPSLDKSCGGNLQGRFRLERGQFYYEYLQLFSKKEKIHKVEVVPNVAHSGEKMVISKAAIGYMFN